MFTWLNDLIVSTNSFMPHGACYLWLPSILWLHVVSDAIIALAYYSIPVTLWYFARKRTDLVYRWLLVLFGIFILLCGTTHLMSIWTIWHPDYWLDGWIKFATAFVSILTAVLIWPLIPKLMRLPSPAALKASETFIRAIFNATPDAMLIINEQGIITMVNQEAENLLGYKAYELIGQPIEVLAPERFRTGHPGLRTQFAASPLHTTIKWCRVSLALKKDNTEIDVEISLSPIHTEQGLFFASALRDVTLRKQAEAALQASEERFRRIANQSPIMIWITDEHGESSFVNQSWLDFTGFTSPHASYEQWIKTVHPDDRTTACMGYYQNTQSKDSITTEYRLRGADGAWHWILDKGVPLYNENGMFSGYMGSAIDITERKQTEVYLRVAAVAFETQQAMVITDADGIILQVNNAFCETTGYPADEAVGQNMSLLNSDRHDDAFYAAMWKSIEQTGSWQGEIWDRRKNGETYLNWLTITAVKGDDGVVSHYVSTHIDITERKSAEEEIKQLAFYDPLTQLPNRRLLLERLKYSIEIAHREGHQLALLMLDLDRFKGVNDSLGHQAGDALLQQVAARIKTRLRDADTVARLGGDEFIVLLEDILHQQDAARVAEKIIADLSKTFHLTQSDNVWIGASIGISLYPEHGDSLEMLIDHADAALYQAKDRGRGCFAYFSESLTHAVRQRIILEGQLRRAIQKQQLCVFYQPQVDMVTGLIIGAEALVRWHDPIEGLISPARFIPIAEETNLILAVGEWVLRTTCNQGRKWLEMGLPPLILAVNVSPNQFKRSDINALVATILAETSFPAEQLELEITESGLMENQDNAMTILNSLNNQGVRLAIDDFGTGYSSLACLKRFPLDVLKIDKGFIDDIPHNNDDMEITATIVAMGHTLNLKVIAEGVETPEQLAFLRKNGCDFYQGFIKSRPIPAEEFTQLLQNQQGVSCF